MSDFEAKNSVAKRSADHHLGRRRFLKAFGVGGLGVGAATLLGASSASADTPALSDEAVLNFALNLKYLEAEFYSLATTGTGLPDELTTGIGTRGAVTGGRAVNFKTPQVKQYAEELARDEVEHVKVLRSTLGAQAVARPALDLTASFATAAKNAGVTKDGQTFDPYQDEQLFLWAAYVFEDVGVTALKGAAQLLSSKENLAITTGMLGTEAYQASLIRSTLYGSGQTEPSGLISNARNSLDGDGNDDQGFILNGQTNIVPADENGLVYGRAPERVLNIMYLTPNVAAAGGFFPDGVNGAVHLSGGAPGTAPGSKDSNSAPNATNAPAPGTNGSVPAPTAPAPGGTAAPAPAPAPVPGAQAGVGVTPPGGVAAGSGGTAGGRDAGLLAGGAATAAGAIAAAGGYHHNKKLASEAVSDGGD